MISGKGLKHLLTLIKKETNIKAASVLVLLTLGLFGPGGSMAQTGESGRADKFPYELKVEQEAGLMITGTGLLYASIFGHSAKPPWEETPLLKLNRKDLPFFDRPATNNWRPALNRSREILEPSLSLAAMGALGTHGILSRIRNKDWSDLLTLSLMYFEGLYISTGGELLAKSLINRARPYAYNNSLSLDHRIRPGNNESFPSGNATLMFYNAAFISLLALDLYPNERFSAYIIGGSFVIAELSALWSVRSGMHFPSDVISGAAWGSAVAFFINRIHRKGARGLNIMPWMISKGRGLLIRYRIQD